MLELAKLSLFYPWEIRFIEFMPVGKNSPWNVGHIVTVNQMKAKLETFLPLEEAATIGRGPAKVFRWRGAPGKIGLISPISEHFCHRCNRLRITADGKLRTCLFSDREINLKPYLREGKGSLEEAYFLALSLKPEKRDLSFTDRAMHSIGG